MNKTIYRKNASQQQIGVCMNVEVKTMFQYKVGLGRPRQFQTHLTTHRVVWGTEATFSLIQTCMRFRVQTA